MSIVQVSTAAGLVAALGNAKPGDVIALASGNYDAITIRGINAGGVTITSANPDRPAVLSAMSIRESSGITVSHVEMLTDKASGTAPFITYASSNIHFDAVKIHGTVGGETSTIDPFVLRDSSNVSVTNSEFYNVRHGLGIGGNTGVTITGNSFHDIRTDGIRGGGNSNVLISDNLFTDFYPADGDHADAIQLWTTRTTESARNITITDNLIVRGKGEPIQGVFIRDQVGNLPFFNVTVSGNMVLGGNNNGIALNGVIGGVISGNTVIGSEDHRSWVRVEDSQGVQIKDNLSTFYMADGATRDGVLKGNTMALSYEGNGGGEIYSWLQDHTKFSGVWGKSANVMGALGLSVTDARASNANAPSYVTVEGTAGDDKLKVKAGFDNLILGGAGNDSITGHVSGNNRLVGGTGDDIYAVKGAGDVVIEGSNGGSDTVSTVINFTLPDNVEILRLAVGGLTGIGNDLDNRIVGSSGDDSVFGMGGSDIIQGLDGNDDLSGGAGNDTIKGDGGDDILQGGAGDDALTGGDGSDVLFGDSGDDVIEGGAGMDRMAGGAGADVFRFRAGDIAGDQILDFTRNQDKIDLRSIDARTGTVKDDAFVLIGNDNFHKIAGELRYDIVRGHAVVSGDVDGDGRGDFVLTVNNVSALHTTDFLL